MADLSTILGQIAPQIGQLLGITTPAIAGPPSGGAQAMTPGQPGGPAPSPTMGQIFESPAIQGALDTYLGYLASPRGENRWQRLGQAGLTGMQGYQQAEQQQIQKPMQQAQLQTAQAGATQAQRGVAPLDPSTIQALSQWKAKVLADPNADPQERTMVQILESQARGGKLSNQDVLSAIQKWDEQKKLLEQARAQSAMAQPGMMQWMMEAMAASAAGRPMPPMPATGGPPSMAGGGAPPAAGGAPPPKVETFDVHLPNGQPGKGTVAMGKDGKPHLLYLMDGKWTPAS